MVVSTLPLSVLAQGLSNPNAREQLIAALSEQYGPEDANAIFDSMVSMGVIDKDGNRLTYKIEMDGELYTLEEMRAIIGELGVDLTREVKVDDTVVTLDFIVRLIDFEDYMQFVEENFVKNNVIVTDEHIKMLADLESQLTTQGISLMSGNPEPANNVVVGYSLGAISAANTVDITYTLTGGGPETSVTFTQDYLPGVLGDVVNTTAPTITLTSSNPAYTETITLPSAANVLWNGAAPICYIRLYGLNGGLFANGKSSHLVPVTKSANFAFTAYKNANVLVNPWPKNSTYGWSTNGYWQKGDYDGELKHSAGYTLEAEQVFRLNADGAALANKGHLRASASVFSWAGAGRRMDTSLRVVGCEEQWWVNEIGTPATVSYTNDPDNTKVLNISSYILPAGTIYVKYRAQNAINAIVTGPSMHDFQLRVTDIVAPTVEAINAPAKIFKAGEQVPIVVTFSEPIVQSSELTLTMRDANGKAYTVRSITGLTHSSVTFMFEIPPQTPATLWPVSVSGGARDTSDNLSAVHNFPGTVEPLATTFAYNELHSLIGLTLKTADGSTVAGAYLPRETKGRLEVALFQSAEATIDESTVGKKQNEWLINNTTVDAEGNFTVDKLYASYDFGVTRIPLYITDDVDKLTAEFDLPASGDYKMVLYKALGEGFAPVIEAGYNINFSKTPLVLVEEADMTINYPLTYPSGGDKVLRLGDAEQVRLSYTISGNATYKDPKDFYWVSSNEAIAVISPTGEVTPQARGMVRFGLVAKNGSEDKADHVTKMSAGFSVIVVLDSPSLAVSRFIITKQGLPVQVMWSTNIIEINQNLESKKDTVFDLELYEGNYASVAALDGETPTYTATSAANASSLTIPGEELSILSVGMVPAYTVVIITDNPLVAGEKVQAVGNIIVTSPPASVRIERPASYYILDTATAHTVNWSSSSVNDTSNGHVFEFEVIRNRESITKSQSPSGSYTITFGDVTGRLKDVYTVTAKIKNIDDDAYSYDSFVLHVYDADAMKIWVDKQDPSSTITMDNAGRISGMTSADIVALERNISLTNKLSINYGDYPYGLVTDQVEWKSSNSSVASINYSRGGAYNNIEDYDLSSYMPDTNFILAGLKDGTTTINATHKLSRMTDTLGVTVKTLRNKLYLFQAMPMVKTQFVYTNGDGIEITVDSDDQGAIAIYEPNGIKSDLKLTSVSGGSTYMGTIYNATLLSGENDGSKGLLYPINNFVLRKAAQVDMNFKNPDGTPYTGTVTIRGGVYKNGNYCEESEISDSVDAWRGTIAVNPVNGFYRQEFDITRFWSAAAGETSQSSVSASDRLDYVFEFQFANDAYLPQIVTFSGNLSGADVLRFGESVVNLVATETSAKNKPFFAAQFLDRYKKSGRLDNIKNTTGNIGLNAQTPKMRIDTQALWWGTPTSQTGGSISILNERGVTLSGQNYRTFLYPFATILVTEHRTLIDASNIWIDETGRGQLTVKLFNQDQTLYNSTLAPYSIRNLMNVENVSESDDINQKFQDELQKSIKAGSSFDATDKFVSSALTFVSNIKFGNDNFSLMLAPTADPTVFAGLLQLNIGDDVMDMGPAEDGFSLMLDDDEVDKAGKGKAGFAKARELASSLKDEIDSLKEGSGGLSHKYQVGGHFSCQVYYNFEVGKWAIRPIGGGIRAGVSIEYSKSGTQFVGPVPVAYEIALGAAVRLEFDVHMLYEPVTVGGIEYNWREDFDSVTDYLTNLRIRAFIYAFGGLGIDFSVVALKIGVFGEIVLENENKFLNRNYLDPAIADQHTGVGQQTEKALSGSRLELKGQVGIKFVAKLLFISYQKTFASLAFNKEWTYRNWEKIETYWEETTGDMLTASNMRMAAQLYAAATGQDYVVVSQAPQLESRSYLNDFARSWGAPSGRMQAFSLDTTNLAPSTLQSNAYPYANPLIADDGSLFVYLSDNDSAEVWATTVNYAVRENGSYVDRGAISQEANSFGDSQLSLASGNGLALATWTRLRDKIDKNPGDNLTEAEMSMMTNNTEVYASVYNGNSWATTRLTDNTTPDMAPVVATNGSKAIVAWRSLFVGDPANPTDFSGRDHIVYRIFDGTTWSETKTLYNGISGSVVGLQAAMLSDGTAAIAYIIDTGEERDASEYEVVYGIVAASGEAVKNVRLTNDNTSDENPQLAVATFGDDDERFILGWYKLDGDKPDIRLATFGNDGNPREDFVDSLYAVSSGNTVGGNFKFINTSTAHKDFKNLSILWTEYDQSTASDSLKAIKFMRETVDGLELTFTSAAIDVAQMPAKTVIDSFDAYVSDAVNDEVKVIILGTESKDEYDTVVEIDDGETISIDVPRTESKMFTATETYQNKARITAADFNFNEILSGFLMPIVFTVQNQGKELMTAVTISYGTQSRTFSDLKILPGASSTFVVNHIVPENIADLAYSGEATFGSTSVAMTGGGTLPLAVTDLGIAKIVTTKEQDGLREFAVSLYNSSDYKLRDSGKTVKLAIYDSSAYIAGEEIIGPVTISASDALALVDNGAYTANLEFDIRAYLAAQGKTEIPANGVMLYAKVWVEDSAGNELPEFVGDNNFDTILCENLVKRNNGSSIKVDVAQSNSATATTAVLTLQNLAMAGVTNGNVAVNLLDEGGNIIKTQYLSNTAESLVALGSEAVINKTFVFDTLGADVEAYYFTATADSMNADLQVLGASGVALNFDKNTTTYGNLSAQGLKATNITAITANPNAKVVLRDAGNIVLAEQTGAITYTLPLLSGNNTFKVTVEPDGEGAEPKTYALTVANSSPATGSVTLTAPTPGTRGWWNGHSVPVNLTAAQLSNFNPTTVQFKVNDGDWTSKNYTTSPVAVTTITAEGTHVISARLEDADSYNLTANSLTIRIDRTAPVIVAGKTAVDLLEKTLTVSTEVTDVYRKYKCQ